MSYVDAALELIPDLSIEDEATLSLNESFHMVDFVMTSSYHPHVIFLLPSLSSLPILYPIVRCRTMVFSSCDREGVVCLRRLRLPGFGVDVRTKWAL